MTSTGGVSVDVSVHRLTEGQYKGLHTLWYKGLHTLWLAASAERSGTVASSSSGEWWQPHREVQPIMEQLVFYGYAEKRPWSSSEWRITEKGKARLLDPMSLMVDDVHGR